MKPEFWQNRWQENRIGFHLDQVNPKLVKHIDAIKEKNGGIIFVPLCGKSLDLVFLADKFEHVIGLELVTSAVESFFHEQNLKAEVTSQEGFKIFKSKNITLINGNIFDLPLLSLPNFDFIYDRASLVALDTDLRERYVALLNAVAKPGCKQLLISFAYDQAVMSGPPFSISEELIKKYYQNFWQIEKRQSQEIIQKAQNFADRGLSSLFEEVYALTRK